MSIKTGRLTEDLLSEVKSYIGGKSLSPTQKLQYRTEGMIRESVGAENTTLESPRMKNSRSLLRKSNTASRPQTSKKRFSQDRKSSGGVKKEMVLLQSTDSILVSKESSID